MWDGVLKCAVRRCKDKNCTWDGVVKCTVINCRYGRICSSALSFADPENCILKAYICGHSIAGTAGSNTAESMDIRLFCVILDFLSEVGEICALIGYFCSV